MLFVIEEQLWQYASFFRCLATLGALLVDESQQDTLGILSIPPLSASIYDGPRLGGISGNLSDISGFAVPPFVEQVFPDNERGCVFCHVCLISSATAFIIKS